MEEVQQKAMKIIKVLEHLLYEGKLQDLGLLSLEKKRLQEDLIAVYRYLIRRYKEDRVRLLREVK